MHLINLHGYKVFDVRINCVLHFVVQMQVAGMPAYTDLTRAHEIANQARRLHKDLRDALNDAAKYNNRERLFDMPVTNVSCYS
jgi:hypothetical protein